MGHMVIRWPATLLGTKFNLRNLGEIYIKSINVILFRNFLKGRAPDDLTSRRTSRRHWGARPAKLAAEEISKSYLPNQGFVLGQIN